MAEEIIIGKLIIDNSDLNAAMVSSKKAIVDLENEQKKLKKDTEGLSSANEEQLQSFIDNETELKKLKAEYAANQKSVFELTKAQNGLDDALAKIIKTQNDAIANTNDLIKARRQIDATTTEGAKAIAEINAKIDENNRLMNSSNSQLEQQKVNIGNYGDEFKNAASNLNPLNGGLEGFIQRSGEAGGAGNLVANSLGGMAQGFLGVAKAGLAFIATPVGAFVLALVVIFGAITNAMNRSEEATAKITKVFALFSGVINALLKAIVPLGEYFINYYVKTLEKVAEVTDKAFQAISSGLKFLGFNDAAKSVDNFTGSVKDSIKVSQDLATAELQLEKSQRKARLTQLQYQKEAEKFRQIRDDENRSIAERIKANDDLGATLKRQLKDELAIAQTALKVVNLRIKAEGSTKATLDAQAEALTQIADIQERITGQESEQLANRVSLQKEAAEKVKKIQDEQKARADKAFQDSLKNAQNEIEILKLKAAASNLTTAQQLANAQKVFDLETALAKKSTSGSDQTKALLEARQNLSSSVLEITAKQIDKEIEQQNRIVATQKATTAEIYDAQTQSAEDLAKAQILRLDKNKLGEKAYADEVIRINAAKNETLTTIQANFDEAETANRLVAEANRKALDDVAFQIKLQDIQDRDATEQEVKRALLQANYDNDLLLLQEQLEKEKSVYGLSKEQLIFLDDKYSKDKSLIKKRYDAETKKDDKILAAQKKAANVDMVQQGIGALQALFGESKALSVASALVNTYTGITAALKEPTLAGRIIGVSFAAATGFAAVKNILKTNKDSSSGGSTSSTSVATSGTGSFVNTSQTETIARVSERPTEQNTVVTPPVLVLETLAEVQNNVAIKINSN